MWRVLALVILVACDAKVEFRRLELPGFALDAPTSLVAPVGVRYDRGETRYKSYSAVYSVTWGHSALPEDPKLIPGFVQALRISLQQPDLPAPRRVRVAGHDALRFDEIGLGEFWSIVAVSCGDRVVDIMVHADKDGDRILARMLDHFDCHPVIAEEKRLTGTAPFGLDDRSRIAGWHRMRDPGAFMISDGPHAVTFKRSKGDWHREIEMLTRAVPWRFGPRTTAPDGQRMWADFTVSDETTGVVEAWPCGDDDAMLSLAIGYDPPAAREMLSAFRCARPGDAPFPELAEVPAAEPELQPRGP